MAEHSPSAKLEFLRIGQRVIGHAFDDRLHYAECDYPFKGRTGGTLLWLAPQD